MTLSSTASMQKIALTMLAERMPKAATWTAIDYPMHLNVGDGAITLGQACLARHLKVRHRRVLDRTSYRPELVDAGSLPVIAGGGNWGGLYPTHHQLRLQVLSDLKGRDVVQMPQSIHYATSEHREELRRAVGEHGRFVLLVRDQRSYEIAVADYDCLVHLVPDLVFTLGKQVAPQPTVEVVTQARTDREAQKIQQDSLTFDWLHAPRRSSSSAALTVARATNRAQRRMPRLFSGPGNVAGSALLARINLRRGLALLGAGKYVVTDRLHGHVLSYLLGRPHVAVDDRYGKVRALHETWLIHDNRSILVSNWAEVPQALEDLRDSFPEG